MAIRVSITEPTNLDEVHDINVTPFIDVMLVLSIIFMVAAPLATVDIPVDLPSSSAQQQPRPSKPVYLTIKADLRFLPSATNRLPRVRLRPRSMPRRLQTKTSASSCAPIAPCRMAPSCRS